MPSRALYPVAAGTGMILVQLAQGEAARLTDDRELVNAAAMRLVAAA
ncbi:hypothetical protein [Streptomyces sp. Ru71]|nr:hypothetical protein [Streptomyces sp. Ru71]